MNIFTKEVYVFTPKGEIKKIPSGATVIDFAYEIHTEVGNKAIAAKVNHQLKPLSHVLKSGDQVEILTSDKQSPKREWLNFAITTKAKNRIKSSLKEDRRYHIDKGQEIFIKKVRELNLKLDHKRFKELRKTYNTPHKEDFYFKIGSGLIQIDDLEKQAAKTFKTFASYWKLSIPKFRTSQPKSKKNTLIIDDNADTKRITLAKCCNPIPGDEVAGFVNPNESIIIHKRICERLTNLAATQGDRIISVKWTSYKLQSFKAKIQIEGMDKLGMLNKITKVISLDSRVNIKTLSFNTDDEIFSGEIILYVHNLQDLEDIMKDLLKIDGVEKVTRLEE
jgi:GTP pyrophosphokinase